MRLLVDTHVLIWAMDDPSRLTSPATAALQDPANDLLLSAAVVWELAIKVGQKKLMLSLPYRRWMEKAIADLDLTLLPVTVAYADRQVGLQAYHKDPFARLIIA